VRCRDDNPTLFSRVECEHGDAATHDRVDHRSDHRRDRLAHTRNRLVILAGIAAVGTQNWTLRVRLLIITAVVALTVRNSRAAMRQMPPNGRFVGFRQGLAAMPFYFVAVGVGHVALAMVWYDHTTGLARDGQAFSGTMVLGIAFVLLGLATAPFAIPSEPTLVDLVRGALAGLGVGAAVVAYTASQGYVMGGTAGELRCIVEQGREICSPGDGTWIMDARPDVFLMILPVLVAYLVAHVIARRGGLFSTKLVPSV